ncbi:MAG TPA: hypothetical protein VGG01_09605 [Xanthobacteraceae bacterium]
MAELVHKDDDRQDEEERRDEGQQEVGQQAELVDEIPTHLDDSSTSGADPCAEG